MNIPLVTIGITAWNADQTIERAVRSALEQTYLNTEIIIVDDASADGTWSILEKTKQQHSDKVTIIQHPENAGVATARNSIINAARGDFIVFFDDDDTSVSIRIERQLEAILDTEQKESSSTPVLCHTARHQTFLDGRTYIQHALGAPSLDASEKGADVASWILTGIPVVMHKGSCATCSQMARTWVYKDLGGFDVQFRRSEDTEFCIRAGKKGAVFIGIQEPLVHQTMTTSNDKSLKIDHDYMRLCMKKHADLCEETSDAKFCLCWLDLKYLYQSRKIPAFFATFFSLFLKYPTHTFRRISVLLSRKKYP